MAEIASGERAICNKFSNYRLNMTGGKRNFGMNVKPNRNCSFYFVLLEYSSSTRTSGLIFFFASRKFKPFSSADLLISCYYIVHIQTPTMIYM